MISDSQLVARAGQGDVEAFGQLAERYERSLLAAALAQLRDLHSAEDAVQATLLVAFRRIGTLRDADKFGAWLMKIVRSQVVETAKARPAHAAISAEIAQHQAADDAGIDSWIENEHLLGQVARLPDHERVLVGLRYFDGHSMAEIAGVTGRPVGTVTKQLSRAVSRLRSWLAKERL